jgi:hypothetical protein
MTRIHTPKFEREQELADAMGRGKARGSKSRMNNLMRGQKDERDRQTEERQARFFTRPEPPEADDIAALRAEAQEAREQAASARRQAESARSRSGS